VAPRSTVRLISRFPIGLFGVIAPRRVFIVSMGIRPVEAPSRSTQRANRPDAIAHRFPAAEQCRQFLDLPLRAARRPLEKLLRILRRHDASENAERGEIESPIEKHRPNRGMIAQATSGGDPSSCCRVRIPKMVGAVRKERRVPIDVQSPRLDHDEQQKDLPRHVALPPHFPLQQRDQRLIRQLMKPLQRPFHGWNHATSLSWSESERTRTSTVPGPH